MRDVIHASEVGPQMALKLANDPTTASEISGLSMIGAVRRMTLLEQDIKTEMSKTAKKVSDAPPPPPKIKAGDPGLSKDVKDMSDKEFAKWREKQIANR